MPAIRAPAPSSTTIPFRIPNPGLGPDHSNIPNLADHQNLRQISRSSHRLNHHSFFQRLLPSPAPEAASRMPSFPSTDSNNQRAHRTQGNQLEHDREGGNFAIFQTKVRIFRGGNETGGDKQQKRNEIYTFSRLVLARLGEG